MLGNRLAYPSLIYSKLFVQCSLEPTVCTWEYPQPYLVLMGSGKRLGSLQVKKGSN